MVFRLHKAKYGLKYALRAWNKRIDNFLVQEDFFKYKDENVMYVKNSKCYYVVFIYQYFDDLVETESNLSEVDEFKRQMMKEFDMTGLGSLTYFFGIEFTKTSKGLVMHQKKYAIDILKRFNIMNFNSPYTSTEVKLKLVNNEDYELVDPTLFK